MSFGGFNGASVIEVVHSILSGTFIISFFVLCVNNVLYDGLTVAALGFSLKVCQKSKAPIVICAMLFNLIIAFLLGMASMLTVEGIVRVIGGRIIDEYTLEGIVTVLGRAMLIWLPPFGRISNSQLVLPVAYASTTFVPVLLCSAFILLLVLAKAIIIIIKAISMYFLELATEKEATQAVVGTLTGTFLGAFQVICKVIAHFNH